MSNPASPCIGVCQIAPQTGWCKGCGRSLAEIAAWPTMAPREKAAVLARLGNQQQLR